MATVVLVHGIAQEQLGAKSLEKDWLPALADGVRAGGHPRIADRIWPPEQPGGITARMAYFGDLFLTPGTMGTGEDDVAEVRHSGGDAARLLGRPDPVGDPWVPTGSHAVSQRG